MVVQLSDIKNMPNIEINGVIHLELVSDGNIISIPKALIKSINNNEITFEMLANYDKSGNEYFMNLII